MRQVLIAEKKANCFPMPWRLDSTCFNFRCPDEHFRPSEDLGNLPDVETLVITSDLTDYSFISDMINLRYLYIYSGNNVRDLSFIENLVNLGHLCLYSTHITSLEPLMRLAEKKDKLFGSSDDLFKRLQYSFHAIYIDSDCLDFDPNMLNESRTLQMAGEFIFNRKNYVDML